MTNSSQNIDTPTKNQLDELNQEIPSKLDGTVVPSMVETNIVPSIDEAPKKSILATS